MRFATNWYVYTDDGGGEWAIQLSPAIGGHHLLGFRHLGLQVLPVIGAAQIRPRYVRLKLPAVARRRTVPVGSLGAVRATSMSGAVALAGNDGTLSEWQITGYSGESGHVLPWQAPAQTG